MAPEPNSQVTRAVRGTGWKLALSALLIFGSLAVVRRETIERGGEPSVGVLFAGAFLFLGILTGFVFGLPRYTPPKEQESADDDDLPDEKQPHSLYAHNTNLQEISDWLTKILVGVGLTQLSAMPRSLRRLAVYVSPAFGGDRSAETFAIAIVIYFSSAGFLFGYLWTRITLRIMLEWADVAADPAKLTAMLFSNIRRTNEVERRAETLERRDVSIVRNFRAATLAIEALREGAPKSELEDALKGMQALNMPYDRTVTIIVGRIYKALGNLSAGIESLSDFLRLHPNETSSDVADVLYNRACYKALLGDSDGAFEDLNRSLSLSPENRESALQDPDFNPIKTDHRWLSDIVSPPKTDTKSVS